MCNGYHCLMDTLKEYYLSLMMLAFSINGWRGDGQQIEN